MVAAVGSYKASQMHRQFCVNVLFPLCKNIDEIVNIIPHFLPLCACVRNMICKNPFILSIHKHLKPKTNKIYCHKHILLDILKTFAKINEPRRHMQKSFIAVMHNVHILFVL